MDSSPRDAHTDPARVPEVPEPEGVASRTRSACEAFTPAAPALLSLGCGDDPFNELDEVDEDDVDALAEIARRLKKARR